MKNVDKFTNRTLIRNGWKNFFGFDVPEDRLMCVGCFDEGSHQDTECPVRPCALKTDIQNCSFCNLFESCDTLRSRAGILDETKKKFADKSSQEEYELFFRPYEGRKELKKQRKKQ
jgi:Golgi nucleoside diphosphatase